MKFSKNSLGGQNNHGRMSGARSSRASSTIFKKLQKLDRQISNLEKILYPFGPYKFGFGKSENKKLEEKIKKLDLKRKKVRLERKKYYEI
jgi:hypothetical protein